MPHTPEIEALIRAARSRADAPFGAYLTRWRSLAEPLAHWARTTPDAPFLIYHEAEHGDRRVWTYADFYARAARIATLLRERYSVREGERVATLAGNHPDTIALYFAAWMLGAIATPQNASEDDARISFILKHAGCRVLLAKHAYLARAQALARQTGDVAHVVDVDGEEFVGAVERAPMHATDGVVERREQEALLVYTSGTTAAPKGVRLCHYNVLMDAQAMAEWQAINARTRFMTVLPMHHMNGIAVTTLTPLLAGASSVLEPGFSVNQFWKRVAAERVNVVSVVPTLLQYLCEADEDLGQYDLSCLTHVICGAGTLPVALAKRFEARFPKPIMHIYGLSETTALSTVTPFDLSPDAHRAWLADHGYPSIGIALSANDVAVHDTQGRALAEGEKGEIVMRGANVMLGYLDRPDANAETFKHGWFRSGDEGFYKRDERGREFYFITGRLKELINRGGVKYSPFEIEEVLLEVPGVKVALAIGFENDWYGEEVGAYVVRDAGAAVNDAQILAHARSRMPYPKCPKVVVFGTDVPVTATGKFQRLKLAALFGQWRNTQFREGT